MKRTFGPAVLTAVCAAVAGWAALAYFLALAITPMLAVAAAGAIR